MYRDASQHFFQDIITENGRKYFSISKLRSRLLKAFFIHTLTRTHTLSQEKKVSDTDVIQLAGGCVFTNGYIREVSLYSPDNSVSC